MLEVPDALAIVLRHASKLAAEPCALTPAELGRVLASDIAADRDSPPFDKSLRDGYAVRSTDIDGELHIVEEIQAGAIPKQPIGAGECSRIFTGAPIPEGADAIVMQEETTSAGTGHVRITQANVAAGQWIYRRGEETKAGDIVVPTGTVLTPAAFGILANVGCTHPSLYARPSVAVLATGDELVDASEQPGPGQIRNSNGPMLTAQVLRAGAQPRNLGIARDTREKLRHSMREALTNTDVLLLAGGVSVGDYDLVPTVLLDLGVTFHFRQVRMKPGKPLLFGTKDRTLVFGLPGNPVSAFVSFELFVKPALRTLLGLADPFPAMAGLPLMAPLSQTNDRPTYYPARIDRHRLSRGIHPLSWGGAPDLRSMLTADVLIELPAGESQYESGETVPVIFLT